MHKQGLPSLMDVCVMCSELLANLVNLSKTQPDYRWVALTEPRIFVSTCKMYNVVSFIHILLNTFNYYVKTKKIDSAVMFNTVLKCVYK